MEVDFEKAFQNGQNMEFNGNRFDDPSYDNLVVTEESIANASCWNCLLWYFI